VTTGDVRGVGMRFGLLLGYCPPDQLVPIAVEAESSGWHDVAVPDSVFYPERVSAAYPYSADGSRFWGPERSARL
jgi:hypothetical protein